MLIKVWRSESGDIIAFKKVMKDNSPTITNLLVL